MAWHTSLYADLNAAMDGKVIQWNETSEFWGQRGTANYRMMFIGAHYLFAVRHGTKAQLDKARMRALDLLAAQEKFGHMTVAPNCCEQFCFDPHANFWLASMVAITRAAIEDKHEVILAKSKNWWGVHFRGLRLGWDFKTESLYLPGTRIETAKPVWSADLKVFQIVQGISFHSGAGEWLSVKYFKDLYHEHPEILNNVLSVVGTCYMPMTKTNLNNGDTVISMAKPAKPPLFPVDWVRFGSKFEFGKNWDAPVPTT